MSPPCNLHYVEFGVNRGDSLEDFVNRDFRKDGGLQKALADALPSWHPVDDLHLGRGAESALDVDAAQREPTRCGRASAGSRSRPRRPSLPTVAPNR